MNKGLTLEEKFNKAVQLLADRLAFEYICKAKDVPKVAQFAYIGLNVKTDKEKVEDTETLLSEIAPEALEHAKNAVKDFKNEGYKEYENIPLKDNYDKAVHLLQCILRNGYIGIECFNEKFYDEQNAWIEKCLEEIEPTMIETAKKEAADFKKEQAEKKNK